LSVQSDGDHKGCGENATLAHGEKATYALMVVVGLAGCARTAVAPSAAAQGQSRAEAEQEEVKESVAVMLVVDRSGSMSGPKGDAARAATKESLRELPTGSHFGVISFAENAATVVPMRMADDVAAIEQLIQWEDGGGTEFAPPLIEARRVLRSVKADRKHVLFFTDGQGNYFDIPEIVESLRRDGITISCVGIGSVDLELLQLIAGMGGGRVHVANTLEDLPRLFVLDVQQFLGVSDDGPHSS
jgi:Mg-chelatase subunit ChlD